MKILIATPYFLPKIGGVEKYTHSLAVELRRQGNQVVIVTSGVKDGDVTRETMDGLTVYRLPFQLTISNTPVSLKWGRQLRKIIAAEQPDIINGHSPVPFMADVAGRVAKRLGVPFVLTYHSGSMLKGKRIPDMIIGAYEKHFLPKLLKASAAVTTYNPFIATTYPKYKKDIYLAAPGVDTKVFTPSETITADPHQLLYVGRMDRTSSWKGVHILLDALAILLEKDPGYALRLVGSGDAVEDFRAQAQRLGIANHVTFAGERFGRELADEYQQAGVFVLPSISESESFGIVLIEAMACGTPVVASNIGGMPQVIKSTGGGLLARPGNAMDLAATIKMITDNDHLRTKLSEAGLASVRDNYTWKHTAAVYENVFGAATAGARPIVHITPYYLPKLGGMERVAHELVTATASAKTPVTVITSTIGAGAAPRIVTNGHYRVERLRALFVANTPLMPSLFFRLLRFPRTSVFHMHVAQAFVPEVALLAAKIKGIPFIAHFHLDTAPSGRWGFLVAPYKKLLFPRMLQAADRVVVFSEEQKTLVTDKYGVSPERVAIIPNGVGEQFFAGGQRSLGAKPRLLFVGRLDAQKNVAFMLRSLDGISEQFETHLVGSGQLSGELKKLAKKLKLDDVHFDGRADGEELMAQYRKADVFVLPSNREGMPLVLLEAMAMGLPVVATDVTGTRDLVANGKNGLLVPLNNEAALRDALLQVAGDKDIYKHMSEAATATARGYAWPAVAAMFAELYKPEGISPAIPAAAARKPRPGAIIYEARSTATIPLTAITILLTALCGGLVAFGVPTLWVAPLMLFLLPGYLLAKLLVRSGGLAERAAYIAGFSVLLGEGIGLLNALCKPILHTNGFAPAWIAASYAVLTTALLAIVRRQHQDSQTIVLHQLYQYKNSKAIVFSVLCLALPVLSYLGATRLNNGANGSVVITMISLSLALGAWLFWQERKKPLPLAIPVFIFTSSLAYLLMFAARSHFLVGWDIQQELGVASLTQQSQEWTIRTLQDPYNAMLSITVLPAALASMLHTSLLTVFKFVIPILFSIMPVTVYLLARNIQRSRLVALGAALFFIGQYQFMQEMPALARQEIGFLFFGLLLVALTSTVLTKLARNTLLVLFGAGLIVSHYSTAYLAIGLLAAAYIASKLLGRLLLWRTTTHQLAPARVTFGFLAFMIAFAFIWNVQITHSSNNIQKFASNVWTAIPAHLPSSIHWPKNRTVTGGNVVNAQARRDYSIYIDKKYHLVPGATANAIQPAVSDAIPMRNKTAYRAVGITKDVLQWGVRLGGVIGCVVLIALARRKRSVPLIEITAMAGATIVLISIIQLVPGWSAQYNIERLAQQAMVLVAPVIFLALYTAAKRLSVRLVMPVVFTFAGLTILLSSGLAAQAAGGTATLNINSYGEDYDRFYVTASEAASADWLAQNYNGSDAVFADRYAARRLVNYSNLPKYPKNDILPQTLTAGGYVYTDHANAQGLEKSTSGQGIITFKFPTDDIQHAKDVIYRGQGTIIYK
ncbi:MAG TPA: glycosyltransferase [Candidatus Saccharimonadales bacterium]|jgi:glycosyltransferase involved in cell wall biosynthesis/uncharacterized membrane protein|nr:glycosyltransferase [Candidatus Saccharimonadales bacterium]